MTWWTKDKWTKEERREAQEAYFYTFLSVPRGRKVLAHLRLMADILGKQNSSAAEQALCTLALKDFVEWIRQQCGPCDELKRIEAESESAQLYDKDNQELYDRINAGIFALEGFTDGA